MNIFIVGLRRSGTTVFWRMFRGDDRLLCLDEPFNPLLSDLPRPHEKGTRAEIIDIYESQPDVFRRKFSPIEPKEEIETGLTDGQSEYLTWLLGQNRHVVCDFTRCAFKIEDLHRIDPSAVLVHLHRRPESVATSHLLPSGSGTWRRPLANIARRLSFWWRRGWYDNWNFETIIGQSPDSRFGDILLSDGIDAEAIYQLPAVGRLMAYWAVAYERVERVGRKAFAANFVSTEYERFCASPLATVTSIYDQTPLSPPEGSTVDVRSPSGPFQPTNRRWGELRKALEKAGIEGWSRESGSGSLTVGYGDKDGSMES